MKAALRTLLAVVAGMGLAFALVVAVEGFSAVVHPIPENFTGTIPDHVRNYPAWVLAVVVPMWGFTIFAATWTASRLGATVAWAIVALLLAWALIFNMSMLPYPWWFEAAMYVTLPVACWLGLRRRPAVPRLAHEG